MHEEKYITHTKGHCITEVGTEMSLPERRTMADSIIEFIKRTVIGIIAATLSIGQAHTEAAPKYTQEDVQLVAEVIYHENWYTDKDHLAAYYTGAVIYNRWKSPNWPDTIKGVIYQKNQYAVLPKLFTEPIPDECYQMAEDILKNGTPDVPANVVYQATFKQGSGDWIPPINGEHFCFE